MIAHHVAVQAGLRYKLYREMEPHARTRPGLSSINSLIVGLVVLSFILFALETESTITGTDRVWVTSLNLGVLVVFAIEYVARLWVAGEEEEHKGLIGRLRYAVSVYALADLAAFLPELLWLATPHENNDSVLMFLRVLRLVRLLKIARFIPAFQIMGAALRRAASQLMTALCLAMAMLFVSAVLLYFIEGVGQGREEFGSIPRSIWWAVATLTSVGYGDIYPVTTMGKIAASVIAFAGIALVALPTGIIASAFSDELRERSEARLATKVADLVVEEMEQASGASPKDLGAGQSSN
jgi:voltage-gated potassium channel